MLLPHFIPDKESTEKEAATSVTYYSEKLEEKIRSLIEGAEGVGSATVVVTLEGTGEHVFAKDEKVSESSSAYDYVIINGGDGEEPVLVEEIYPRVRGVAVVCTGGENAAVKKRVTELVAAALGIAANKIAVSG